MDKILGQGVQKGGFMVPRNKLDQLITYKHLLTEKQKRDILQALQTGQGVVIKPKKKQLDGGIGRILASIGIPMLLDALTGKGSHAGRNKSLDVYVPGSSGGAHGYPMMSPPFIGSWPKGTVGRGKKSSRSKKGNGLVTSLLGITQTAAWNRIPVLRQLI